MTTPEIGDMVSSPLRSAARRQGPKAGLLIGLKKGKRMRLKAFTAPALALSLLASFDLQAAIGVGADAMSRLVQAAYFSDACRREAEALNFERTSDANALFAAFRRRLTIARGDERPDSRLDDCRTPVVLLINLLRLSGLEAELVFASMTPTATTEDGAWSDEIDRALVYVPGLDRYFDPMAPRAQQAILDRIIAETGKRIHVRGPSVAGGDACRDTCMHVRLPRNESSVRVKTDVIRSR
jgi:hypothetical protein